MILIYFKLIIQSKNGVDKDEDSTLREKRKAKRSFIMLIIKMNAYSICPFLVNPNYMQLCVKLIRNAPKD